MSKWCENGCVSSVRRLFVMTALSWVSLIACHAQLDTSFWFVAPEVCQWNNPTNFDRPIKLVFSTPGNVPATVTIRLKAEPTLISSAGSYWILADWAYIRPHRANIRFSAPASRIF